MPKVLYPNDVGISDPDIIEVRISTALTRRKKKSSNVPTDHILKVRHRIFGWLSPWEWGMLAKVEGFMKSIDPLSAVAWVSFTVGFKGTIDSAQALVDWLTGKGTEAVGTLANFFLWWAQGTANFFGILGETFTGEGGGGSDGPSMDWGGPGKWEDSTVGNLPDLLQMVFTAIFGEMGKRLFPYGEISEWLYAAAAGAISVLALKHVTA